MSDHLTKESFKALVLDESVLGISTLNHFLEMGALNCHPKWTDLEDTGCYSSSESGFTVGTVYFFNVARVSSLDSLYF